MNGWKDFKGRQKFADENEGMEAVQIWLKT
jgi:hypothetical protein